MRRWSSLAVAAPAAGMLAGGCADDPPLARNAGLSQAELGQATFRTMGCNACHTTDGTPNIGPSLRDVYGTERTLTDGRVVLADEAYIRRSIMDHGAEIVEGYAAVGPSYGGRITAEELDQLVAFVQSISEHSTSDDDEPSGIAEENGTPSEPG